MSKSYWNEEVVEGHFVTLDINDRGCVLLCVNDWIVETECTDRIIRLRIALAAKRLWKEALEIIPPGAYHCWPTSEPRRRLYLAAGWRPAPLPLMKGALVFYHKIPPLPEGWMNWML